MLHPEGRQELARATRTPSKKVMLLYGEFWEIRISERENLEFAQEEFEPLPGTPGSAQHLSKERNKRVFSETVMKDEKQH